MLDKYFNTWKLISALVLVHLFWQKVVSVSIGTTLTLVFLKAEFKEAYLVAEVF